MEKRFLLAVHGLGLGADAFAGVAGEFPDREAAIAVEVGLAAQALHQEVREEAVLAIARRRAGLVAVGGGEDRHALGDGRGEGDDPDGAATRGDRHRLATKLEDQGVIASRLRGRTRLVTLNPRFHACTELRDLLLRLSRGEPELEAVAAGHRTRPVQRRKLK